MAMTSRISMSLRVALPVLCGLVVAVLLIWKDFDPEALVSIRFTSAAMAGIAFAWLFMFGRDLGYAWRFRLLTDGDLSWRKAARVTMLTEFTSAITPTTVGGSALSAVFMHRSGISPGRATTLMITTFFLDELFFTIATPLVLAIVPSADLFGFSAGHLDSGLRIIFWCVYGGVVAVTVLLFCGVILWPARVSGIVRRLFQWRLLRKWQVSAGNLADDMIITSRRLRLCGPAWWAKAFGATALSWSSRFLVVNALFWGFVPDADQLVVLGRQLVVWMILMISPTPGGSGVSEWLFTTYYGDIIAGGTAVAVVLALFWRIISYYIYLIIGAFLLPSFFNTGHK